MQELINHDLNELRERKPGERRQNRANHRADAVPRIPADVGEDATEDFAGGTLSRNHGFVVDGIVPGHVPNITQLLAGHEQKN